MNSNGINQQPDTSCPDAATLVRYIKGQMSRAEQHQLERHTLDCPFCEEALEGLAEMQSPGDLPGIQAELNERIRERISVKKEAKIIHFPAFRIAAVITILLISGVTLWYLFPGQKSENLFTQEYKPYPAPEPPIVSEPSISVQNEALSKSNTTDTKPAVRTVSPATTASNNEISENEDAPLESVTIDQPAKEKNQEKDQGTTMSDEKIVQETVDYNAAPAALSKAQVTTASSMDKAQFSEKYKADSKKESTAKISAAEVEEKTDSFSATVQRDPFEQGLAYYREARYQEALQYFQQATNQKESSFYSGQCFLSLNRPAEAISNLKIYLLQSDIQHAEAGWWYLALAHLKNNNKEEARTALKKVIDFKGGFQLKAEDLLRKI